jgi:hypothetical protein
MEQDLIENLIVESIKIYGLDCFYIPRNPINTRKQLDYIFNETTVSIFDNNYMLDLYVKNIDSFEGDGTFMSKFGLEIRDQVTFSCAMRTFDLEVSQQSVHDHKFDDDRPSFSSTLKRPREGDLIYLPLNKKIFEIKFVEHESIFYQMGALQLYDLKCELFEYSGEIMDTGIPEVDIYYKKMAETRFTANTEVLDASDFMADNLKIQQDTDSFIDFDEKDPFSWNGKI